MKHYQFGFRSSPSHFLHLAAALIAALPLAAQAQVADPYEGVATQIVGSESQKCVGIPAAAPGSGVIAVQWPCGGRSHQSFLLKSTGDGFYNLQPQHQSNLCLDFGHGPTNAGSWVVQRACRPGSARQKWRVLPNTDGTFSLGAVDGLGCLALMGGSTKDGTRLVSWACDGSPSERFLLPGLSGAPVPVPSPRPSAPAPLPSPTAAPTTAPGNAEASFKRIFTIVLENTNLDQALAQPFLSRLVAGGALLSNFHAVTHPSQPNYIQLVSGDTYGFRDDWDHIANGRHIGDLLEAKGRTWKSYAENYPGNCFTGTLSPDRLYFRKHEPFLSFPNVASDRARCNAHVVGAATLDTDIANGTLPDYALYVPNIRNDGHDTGVAFADQYLTRVFGPRLKDPRFMNGTLFVITFDENDAGDDRDGNRIATVLYGDMIAPGSGSDAPTEHASLLRTIEQVFGLGDLGRRDAAVAPITGVWKATNGRDPAHVKPGSGHRATIAQ